jgi:hypothetical protein
MQGLWPLVPTLCLALTAARPIRAQGSPLTSQSEVRLSDSALEALERPEVRTNYDRHTDTTRLSVVTHAGWFVISSSAPRVVWSVAFPGHDPPPGGTEVVALEMRTQNPQVATSSLFLMEFGAARRFESRSVGVRIEPAMLTNSTWMRFILPAGALSEALEAPPIKLTIGGIPVSLSDLHQQSLRQMLAMAGGAARAARDSAGH